ncbi:MAG: vsr [Herminiimonas sp.]|nr:vsr [Herminiimonas sp.]
MTDIVEKSVRSRMMSSIRGKNTLPELTVRRYLHAQGFRFRIHARSLPGCPDLVLKKYRLALLVHGCFWHRHEGCRYATTPDDVTGKWSRKFSDTVDRDRRNIAALIEQGWRIGVIWECGLKADPGPTALDWLPNLVRDMRVPYFEWPHRQ